MVTSFLSDLLHTTLQMATPLIFAAMGGIITERANLINIGLEGMMLGGAFAGAITSFVTGNTFVGVFGGIFGGLVLSALFALVVIELKANIVIVGLGLSTLATGITAYLLPTVFNVRGSFAPKGLGSLPKLHIPVIENIPFLGEVLSGFNPLVYLSWLAIPATSILLYKTVFGRHIRAVGEFEEAATSVGVNVRFVKYVSILIDGALCGLAGAHLSLGVLAQFTESMTAGRGWMALAAYFFGAVQPALTAMASFLFGLFDALQIRLQSFGVPPQLIQIIPYFVVVASLTIVAIQRKRSEGGIVG